MFVAGYFCNVITSEANFSKLKVCTKDNTASREDTDFEGSAVDDCLKLLANIGEDKTNTG